MIGHQPLTRTTLITALAACAEISVRARARRFLTGLSADELQFIAEFLGSCILEASAGREYATDSVQQHHCRMKEASLRHRDREMKMILLREYLQCSRRIVA